MKATSRGRDAGMGAGAKLGLKFWLWAVLGFVLLLSLQVAKFLVDNKWNPVADIATATSVADLDWSQWIAVVNLIATSLIGGAVAGASAYAIKYLSININSGNITKSSSHVGDRIGSTHIREDHTHVHTDIEHLDSVKAEIGKLLAKFKEESESRRLSRGDFAQLRKLADESVKRRARRMESLCVKLQDQVAALEGELNGKLSSVSELETQLASAEDRLRLEKTSRDEALENLALAKATLADAESFFDSIESFLSGPIALGRAAETLQAELGKRRSG